MRLGKILECAFCRRVSLHSAHFQTYVCDDCYEKQQAEKKDGSN